MPQEKGPVLGPCATKTVYIQNHAVELSRAKRSLALDIEHRPRRVYAQLHGAETSLDYHPTLVRERLIRIRSVRKLFCEDFDCASHLTKDSLRESQLDEQLLSLQAQVYELKLTDKTMNK